MGSKISDCMFIGYEHNTTCRFLILNSDVLDYNVHYNRGKKCRPIFPLKNKNIHGAPTQNNNNENHLKIYLRLPLRI